jgi:RNA polymerase sigma-70 factor (ECF subfamily)
MKQNKEHIAFIEMLRRSDSTIFKICLMFTDRDPKNVKDMYQDIVCSLWESWPRFRGQCKENTWVYSIAFNTAVSQVRHRSLSPMFLSLDDNTYNYLAEESKNSLIERLYELIDRLSPPDKALLLLYLDRIPAREMGQALGITEAAVNHRIERIKDKLKTLNQKTI